MSAADLSLRIRKAYRGVFWRVGMAVKRGASNGLFCLFLTVLLSLLPVVVFADSDSASAAVTLPENARVKNADGPEVYLVQNGKLSHLKDEDAYRFYRNECFIRHDLEYAKSVLDNIGYNAQLVAPSEYTSCPQSGARVKSICLPNVYLFENGQFKWIEDEFTFNSRGYEWGDIVTISERFIPEYNKASECGSLGASIRIIDSVTDPLPRRDLYDFGFGQAVVMNGNPSDGVRSEGLFSANDLALTVPAVANRANAEQNFQFHVKYGEVGTLLYNSVPQTILNLKTYSTNDFTQSFANLNKYLESTGVPQFDDSDLAGLYGPWSYTYAEGSKYHWLNLEQQSTRDKAVALLNGKLAVHSAAGGVFLDNIDYSSDVNFAYPKRLHETVRAFVSGQLSRPLVGANLYSIKNHASNNYAVFSAELFDVVMVEEFGFNGDGVADVLKFHRKFPNTAIIVNGRYTGSDKSLFGVETVEKKKAKDAVVVAALVGGLHAIDGGAHGHGNNTVAHNDLNYPFFRAERPMSDLQETDVYFKRDYKDMVAIYAKTGGDVYVRGRWTDFWTKQTYENGLPLIAGKSYLLFREGVIGAGEDGVEGAGESGNESTVPDGEDATAGDEPVGDSNAEDEVWGGGNIPEELPVVFVPNKESYPFGDGSSCTSPRELIESREEKKVLMYPGESVWFQLNVSEKKIALISLKGLQFGRFGLEIHNDCAGNLSAVTKWQDTSEFRYYQVSPAMGTYFVRVIKEGYDNPGKEFLLAASSANMSDQIELQVLDFFVEGKDYAEDSNVLEVWLRNNGRSFDHMVGVGAFLNGSVVGSVPIYGLRSNETKRVRLVITAPAGEASVTVGNGQGGYGWQLTTQDPDNSNDNRTKIVQFEVARRDLIIESLKVQGTVPYQQSAVTYVVRNVGNLREGFFVSGSQVIGGSGKGSFHYDVWPNQEAVVSYSWMSYQEGNFTVIAQVDEAGMIAEANEENNRQELTLEWKYPVAAPEVVPEIAPEAAPVDVPVDSSVETPVESPVEVIPRGNVTLIFVNESGAASASDAEESGTESGEKSEKKISEENQSVPVLVQALRSSSGGGAKAKFTPAVVRSAVLEDEAMPGAYPANDETSTAARQQQTQQLQEQSQSSTKASVDDPRKEGADELQKSQAKKSAAVFSSGIGSASEENAEMIRQSVWAKELFVQAARSQVAAFILTIILGLAFWKGGRFDEWL